VKMSHYNTGIVDHEQGYGEPHVSQSLQAKTKTKIIKAHVLHPKTSNLHVIRDRDVRVLDLKGLVDKVGTQDLDTHKCTQLIMRVSKMQNLV
jgi:hypothetical protein